MLSFALWGSVCSTLQAQEMDAFRRFVGGMQRNDSHAMGAVVLSHRDKMAAIFFVALKECAGELRKDSLDSKRAEVIGRLLSVCARIARTFDEVYAGRDVLCGQFKLSRPLLTTNVRVAVTSDRSLAGFLESCTRTVKSRSDRGAVAADLASIFAAATEPRRRVVRRLVRLAQAKARVERLQGDGDEQGLIEALRKPDQDVSVKTAAVKALGELRSRRAVDALAALLPDREIGGGAVEALRRIGGERAVSALSSHIGGADLGGRIVDALASIGTDSAVGALVAALDDGALGGRAAAALTRKWGDKAANRFADIAGNRSMRTAVRREAVRAFARLHPRDEFARLGAWASHAELREAVAKALPATEDPRAAAMLVDMLDDASVAGAAMAGLGRMGERAIPALTRRLRLSSGPARGMKLAAEVLDRAGRRPPTAEARAWMAIALGRPLPAVLCGPPGLAAGVAALGVDDRAIRWTGGCVVAVDVGAVAVLLLIAALIWRRKWLWPALSVKMQPGECQPSHDALRWREEDGSPEPGAIVRTLWARSRHGRRQRIKVEAFVPVDEWEAGGPPGLPFSRGLRKGRRGGSRCDVLVTVGRSVRPGTYLAVGPGGPVRVRVGRGRNG